MTAHYEVRPEGEPASEWLTKTGSNTEAEFDRASKDARNASNAMPGRTIEVRYQGWSEPARDLLVAAWRDGELLDIRTQQAKDEHQGR